ncbi:MAG TPA: hypothetical protein VF190_14785 [Rhodothermales bacterium]
MDLNFPSIAVWSFAATATLTAMMSVSHGVGWTRLSLPFLLGAMVTENRGRAMIVGFFMHFGVGVVASLPYALGMEDLGRATWWIGALMGGLHGILILSAVMPLLPYVHRRMASEYHGPTPTRQLEPPGFLAKNYGRQTSAVTFLSHVVYGAILGTFYQVG